METSFASFHCFNVLTKSAEKARLLGVLAIVIFLLALPNVVPVSSAPAVVGHILAIFRYRHTPLRPRNSQDLSYSSVLPRILQRSR